MKNKMLEKKKLKLNQPILSVRKHSSMEVHMKKSNNNGQAIKPTILLHPSPPVKVAGSVPFHWEKTPGKPKQASDKFIQTEESKSSRDSRDSDDEPFVDALENQSTVKAKTVHRNDEGKHETRKDYLLPSRGLLPRFCVKSSVCLVNPVPAKRVGTNGQSRRSNRKKKSFRELLADQGRQSKGGSMTDFNNTVYVDTLHEVDTVRRPFSRRARENQFRGSRKDKVEDEKETTLKELPRLILTGENYAKFLVPPPLLKSPSDSRKDKEEDQKETTLKELPRLIITRENYDEIPVPPPLLKSPSDSWLWRTLLSASTKNVSRQCSNEAMKPGRV